MGNALDWTGVIRRHGCRQTLDVGANVGGFVSTWLDLGADRVLAVEPVPSCFDALVATYGQDPRVTALKLGVSDAVGSKRDLNVHNCWTLLPDLGTGGKPTDHKVGRALEFVGKPAFDVTFTTIDALLAEQSFAPDFIKIDVDGYDAKALRGAHNYLSTRHPLVMVEISYLMKLVGDDCEQMIKDIFTLGYTMTSVVTAQRFTSAKEFMPVFPWRTSFDVLLEPI